MLWISLVSQGPVRRGKYCRSFLLRSPPRRHNRRIRSCRVTLSLSVKKFALNPRMVWHRYFLFRCLIRVTSHVYTEED